MNDYTSFLTAENLTTVRDFINSHWQDTVRSAPRDEGTLIGLPYPYTVPCRKGAFQELYYWDTYFTNLGLIASGQLELAVGNARNLLHLVARFGYVPNGNRTFYLTRSQPPYLAGLVQRVAACPGYEGLLPEAMPLLRREYEFWLTRRTGPDGMAHYGNHATRAELIEFHAEIAPRTGLTDDPESVLPKLSHLMAECESGQDFNPRFDKRCDEFYTVELNCLLYGYEQLFGSQPETSGEKDWTALAAERKEKISQLCWDEERGGFFDYDYVNRRKGAVVSPAHFQIMWSGLASEAQARRMVDDILPLLEFPFGIAGGNKRPDNLRWQFDYPNAWPCMHEVVAKGLQSYGYAAAARRVAGKYLAAVCRTFKETGDLWEKYNVEDGTARAFAEPSYPNTNLYSAHDVYVSQEQMERPPAMMGWTAGVFMSLLALMETEPW